MGSDACFMLYVGIQYTGPQTEHQGLTPTPGSHHTWLCDITTAVLVDSLNNLYHSRILRENEEPPLGASGGVFF